MENNTFTTTVYAQTPATRAFEYLRRLQNLDEWTLGSRMVTRIDDDTFMGTASGYQTMLCYHVRTLEHPRFAAIEWQCGYRYREYFKQYPVFVFPSQYADPRGDEDGSYIHWISVIDPARRTEMIMQGIAAVHHYEGRGLKAALERREGIDAARDGAIVRALGHDVGRCADRHGARAARRSRRPSPSWAPLFRAVDAAAGSFVDEYARRVQVEFTACELGDYVLVEQDYAYPDLGAVQRCPIVLVPSARAFGPEAPGFLLHRIAFVRSDGSQAYGRTTAAELTAESMAIKRTARGARGQRGQLRARDELSAGSRDRRATVSDRGRAAGHLHAGVRRRPVPALSPDARRLSAVLPRADARVDPEPLRRRAAGADQSVVHDQELCRADRAVARQDAHSARRPRARAAARLADAVIQRREHSRTLLGSDRRHDR